MNRIESILTCFAVLVSLTVVTGCQTSNAPYKEIQDTQAAKSIYGDLKASCGAELKTYCDNVTPGEGRIAACLYGNHNKLSAECNQGLIDANARVDKFDEGIGYAAGECADDIKNHCGTLIPGEGRILKCLVEEKRDVVSKRCSQAIKDVGLDLEYLHLAH